MLEYTRKSERKRRRRRLKAKIIDYKRTTRFPGEKFTDAMTFIMMMMERLLLLWWGRRSAGTDPPRTILNKICQILRQKYWRLSLLEWSERLKSNRNYNIFQRILTYLTRMLLMKVRPRKIGSKLYKLRSCEICARSKKHTDERRFETFHFRIYGRLYSTSQLFLRCSYDGQIPETKHPCLQLKLIIWSKLFNKMMAIKSKFLLIFL